jgi:hypothetical protein
MEFAESERVSSYAHRAPAADHLSARTDALPTNCFTDPRQTPWRPAKSCRILSLLSGWHEPEGSWPERPDPEDVNESQCPADRYRSADPALTQRNEKSAKCWCPQRESNLCRDLERAAAQLRSNLLSQQHRIGPACGARAGPPSLPIVRRMRGSASRRVSGRVGSYVVASYASRSGLTGRIRS